MTAAALCFGAHPDDVELTCGGLAAALALRGQRVVIADFTRGEAASRGTPEVRAAEAQAAASALGVAARENLGLPDLGIDRRDREQLAAVVSCLRRHRPSLVVAPDPDDDHPDHVEAGHLVRRACYVAGLARFAPHEGRHRPDRLLFSIYRGGARAQVVVDISAVWERRMAALRAHASQLAGSAGPDTYLSAPGFLAEVEARARTFGAQIGVTYGEGYRANGPLGLRDPLALVELVAAEVRS